ncbi:collagen binding domain-containing protein, partial [Lentilactobacillus kefiri]|uniref:collagen binding domain-containing protein n=1 Tax=Lentilactobacillus kefiri TaxID=33962 RepID=UPI0015CC724E
MSNKSRHRRLLFMMGLVLFSLLGLIWISSNNGMTVYADSKTNITQNGTGSGSVINQHEEQQTSTVNSNTTDNTNSSDDQTSQKPVTNTEAQPRAPAEQNGTGSVINQQEEQQTSTVNSNTTDNTNSSDDQTSQKPVTNTEAQPRAPAEQNNMSMDRSMFISMFSERPNSVNNITNSVGHDVSSNITSLTVTPEKSVSKNWEDQFITKVELQDGNGNPKTNFGIYDNMQAAWNFVIPANKAKSGDTMTVAIPSVLTLTTMTKFDIPDAGGTVIGHAVANPNTGKVTITLTDAVKSNHNAITGGFKLWVHWNSNKVKQDTTVPVNSSNSGSTGSTDIHINSSNRPDPNEVLNKWGWYDTNNPYIIHWRVRINYANKTINNTTYTDLVGGNQKLVPGSVSVYKVKYQSDGSNFNVLSTYPSSSTIENGTSGFTTTLGDISSTVVIDYKTKITNNGISGHYKNNGKLAGSNIEKQTVDVYSPINGGNGNANMTTTPKKPQVPNTTTPKKPQVPNTTTPKKPQVPNTTTPKKPQVPNTTTPKKPQVPNTTTPKKPQVPNCQTTPKPQVPNKPTTPKPQVPNCQTTPKPQVPNTTTPKKPQVPNNGNKVTPKAYTQGKTYEKTGKLPQTGDKSSMGMMLIGLVTLLLSLG